MKDSGIEWIGEIPKHWGVCHFWNIASIYNGNSIKDDEKAQYEDSVDAIPYIATKDVDATFQTINYQNGMYVKTCDETFKRAPNNSVLLCIEGGSAGKKIAFTNQEVCFINKLCCFHSKTINNKFMFYYMLCPAFTEEFKSHISGLIGGVSINEIKSFSMVLPPLSEQEAIADFLDKQCAEIDSVIEQTKTTIEEYKALKQSVITEAVTKGIRGDRPMKDSGIEWIGEIPSEWESVKLKYCTYIRARLGWKGLKADEYVDEGYPLLSAFNIINNKLDFSDVNYINQFRYDESPEIKLSIDDILLVKDGAGIGKCAIVEELPIPSTPNGSLAVVTITNHLYPKFLYYYFLSKMFQKYIDRIKDGMGVPHLFQSDLREIEIVISSLDEQREIVTYLDQKCAEIDTLIEKKTSLLEEMESLKKSIIFEYVTGKKEVAL